MNNQRTISRKPDVEFSTHLKVNLKMYEWMRNGWLGEHDKKTPFHNRFPFLDEDEMDELLFIDEDGRVYTYDETNDGVVGDKNIYHHFQHTGCWNNGLPYGEFVEYWKTGKRKFVANFDDNGKKDGECISYKENGEVEFCVKYKLDLLDDES